jgi:hypothetical protein
MILTYLSAPITKPAPIGGRNWNFYQAAAAMSALMQAGYAVINPMLSMAQFDEIDWETWLAMDCEIVSRCDLVCRLPGVSIGAERECEFARRRNIPVVTPSFFECLADLFEPQSITTCQRDKDNLMKWLIFRREPLDARLRDDVAEGFARVS